MSDQTNKLATSVALDVAGFVIAGNEKCDEWSHQGVRVKRWRR
jgi:hypothetical protein